MIYSPLTKHIFIIEDRTSRRTIALEDGQYTIGRHTKNEIVVSSNQASRYHATLVRKVNSQTQDHSYWILDGTLEGCKSQNGIYVNGEKCLIHELKDGDLINFGCEVNASYHQISNVFDTLVKIENLSNFEKNDLGVVSPSISTTQNEQKIDSPTINHLATSEFVDSTILQNSYLDSLTQLPGTKLFNEHLSLAIHNADKVNKVLAIFLIKLENTLKVHQNIDSETEEKIINEYSKKLKNSLRTGDIIARIQENCFAVLISHLKTSEDLLIIKQRILNNVKSPIEIEEQPYFIKSSIGIATYPHDARNGDSLINRAKLNLEQPQQDNLTSSTSKKSTQSLQFYQIEKLIHEALENDEFSLYYHPQINLKTEAIEGIEALLRWEHPKYGLLTPRRFLPVAEKTELIIPITQWVLKKACQQNLAWVESGISYLPISVNISPRLFQSPYLIKMLSQVLNQTGLDGRLLELEITENSIVEHFEDSLKIVKNIQEMNIKIALDDFGIGQTSLNYLTQLPIQKLKIAQKLIRELKSYPHQTALIEAIIASGRILGKQIVAEGVETQEQLEILQSLKCEQMQGYRFSQPLTATEATQFLSLPRSFASVEI